MQGLAAAAMFPGQHSNSSSPCGKHSQAQAVCKHPRRLNFRSSRGLVGCLVSLVVLQPCWLTLCLMTHSWYSSCSSRASASINTRTEWAHEKAAVGILLVALLQLSSEWQFRPDSMGVVAAQRQVCCPGASCKQHGSLLTSRHSLQAIQMFDQHSAVIGTP